MRFVVPMVVVAVLVGGCARTETVTSSGLLPESAGAASSQVRPSSTPTELPPPAQSPSADVRGGGTGGSGKLVDVRLAACDGRDRFVMEFLDGVPAYSVGYRPLPARANASGHVIALPGAQTFVQVVFTDATGNGWTGGVRTYFGPTTLSADTAVITEAAQGGDFEAVLTWVIGLREQAPFEVSVLDGPPRLVVDFAQIDVPPVNCFSDS